MTKIGNNDIECKNEKIVKNDKDYKQGMQEEILFVNNKTSSKSFLLRHGKM